MDKSLQIIKTYKLVYYLNVLLEHNKSNNNPYHNFYHTMTIVKNIWSICNSEDLPYDKTRLLLISGIFHDFNHLGGKQKDDSENIKLALESFIEYSIENDEGNEFITSMIKCTQFPYDKDESLDFYQMVIRDADILQSLESNYIQQVLFGLNMEMSGSTKLTIPQLENQIKFMSSVEIFTDYTKLKMKDGLQSKIEDIEFLIKALK